MTRVEVFDQMIMFFLRTNPPDLTSDINSTPHRTQLREILKSDIAKPLTEAESELFRLYFVEQRNLKEIAEFMKIEAASIELDLLKVRAKVLSRLRKGIETEALKSKAGVNFDFSTDEKAFIAGLQKKGLIVNLPSRAKDDETIAKFKRINIKGEPISETIIRERR